MTLTVTGVNKKRRIQNACDECKRRKVRCDSANMPDNVCSSCLCLDISCTHDRLRKKRGPKPGTPKGSITVSLRELVDEILKGTTSQSCIVWADNETTTSVIAKLAKRIRHLESELKLSQETRNEVFLSEDLSHPVQAESDPLSSVEDVNQLTQDIARFTLGPSDKPIHFGESSNMMLVVTAMDHRKEADSSLPEWQSLLQNIKRKEYWDIPAWIPTPQPEVYNFQFPDEDEMQQLVTAYFDGHALYAPILYRPSFEKSLSEGLHLRDNGFGALVLAVCAIGSRYQYKLQVTGSSKESYVESGLKWFDQLPIRQYAFGQNVSLYQMQTYCLGMTYLQHLATGNDVGWMMNGLAIRLAQEIGAHRHLVMDKRPTIEGELWKRVFWTLILFDLKLSALFGRPTAISSQDFDLELPVECDDEYWENEDPSKRFVQPPGKPAYVSGWNHYLRLLEIMAFSQQALYSVRDSDFYKRMGISSRDWQQRAVAELDSSLNKWVDSVPSHLKWNSQHEDERIFLQSTILYTMYYWVQIQVHRRFIPRPGQASRSMFPSLAICTNAARSCIRVAETYLSQKFHAAGHFMLPLFSSAMVLAVNLWRGKHTNSNFNPGTELADIYKCVNMIRLHESTFTLAGRLNDIINTVMSVNRGPAHSSCLSRKFEVQGDAQTASAADRISTQTDDPPNPLSPSNLLIDQRDFNLPFSSSELGQLPIHGPLDLHSLTSNQTPDLGYNHVVTNEELAIFEDANLRDTGSFQLQDWDVFMTSVEEMLGAAEKTEHVSRLETSK
ncbi:hypothetical protein K435DRAFT_783681 [Dendrothele bispora CBS 962.96]|uniref:Zn(2)-C6 fungal-type domain-containing protein n=1 Tax=Dendrothele bispora (strain CBS 962.96) TaxID=1314807 RepID=A0A4S8L8W1_DENBC|nr:hypothetical protein K435DRAFT_783681 [Dendrothele bispora CBS 962.96]